jgi:hypothetical protein
MDRNLKSHIWKTYFGLRVGLAALGILLPFYLWLGGSLIWGVPLQKSISHYYHACNGELRDEFVGVLLAVAALLVFYRGYSKWEDRVLDVAGVFLLGVALIPMSLEGIPDGPLTRFHGPSAIAFFFLIAYVTGCRGWDTLTEMEPGGQRTFFQWLYRVIGVLMVALPLLVLLINEEIWSGLPFENTVFWMESCGVWVFGLFWLAKTRELHITRFERDVLEKGLELSKLEGCRFCPPFCGGLKDNGSDG